MHVLHSPVACPCQRQRNCNALNTANFFANYPYDHIKHSCNMNRWSEEWNAVLARPLAIHASAASPGAGSLSTTITASMPSCTSMITATDSSCIALRDAHVSPPRMHYCSASERDEWAAVLGPREAQTQTRTLPDVPLPVLSRYSSVTAPATTAAVAVSPTPHNSTETPGESDGEGASRRTVFVAIELGSHCTRAVLHDGTSEMARFTYDTLLGQPSNGTVGDSGGELCPTGLTRTLDALRRIKEAGIAATTTAAAIVTPAPVVAAVGSGGGGSAARASPAPQLVVRAIATAAARNAGTASRAALCEAVRRLVDGPLEVLSGEEEGRLAWLGVVGGLRLVRPPGNPHRAHQAEALMAPPGCSHAGRLPADPPASDGPLLLVDLGGRSTEFVYGTPAATRPPLTVSIPLGCVSLHGAALAASVSPMGAPRADVAAAAAAAAALDTEAAAPWPDGAGCAEAGSCGGGDAAVRGAEAVEVDCEGGGALGQPHPSTSGLEACVELARQTVLQHCAGQDWLPSSPLQPPPPQPASHAAAAVAAMYDNTSTCPSPLLFTTPPDRHPATSHPTDPAVHDVVPFNGAAAVTAPLQVLVTGGTATTLAALHLQLPYYDRTAVHGSVLTTADLQRLLYSSLAPAGPHSTRADGTCAASLLSYYPWLTAERFCTLGAGCAVLLGIMAALRLEAVVVSDADLLDGLVEEMLERGSKDQGREQ